MKRHLGQPIFSGPTASLEGSATPDSAGCAFGRIHRIFSGCAHDALNLSMCTGHVSTTSRSLAADVNPNRYLPMASSEPINGAMP